MDNKTFLFFGRSGAGKATQAKLLISHLEKVDSEKKVLYVETGQGLRNLAAQDYYLSSLVNEKLEAGGLFQEFLPIWIWTDFLIKNYTGNEHLVLDGCSRRLNEAPVVDGALDFIDCKKRYVIHINVSNEWSKQRLLERGRSDDDEKEIEARLAWYDTNVMPVVENFKNNEKYTFIDVNGEQTIEEVQQELLKKIQL